MAILLQWPVFNPGRRLNWNSESHRLKFRRDWVNEARSAWAARFMYTEWKRWETTTAAQRNLALAAELKRLMPPPAYNANVLVRSGRETLIALSAENAERMLGQLVAAYPRAGSLAANSPYRDQARSLATQVSFSFLRPVGIHQVQNQNALGPMMSPQVLRYDDLNGNEDYYSKLIKTSHSVEFLAFASRNPLDLTTNLGTVLQNVNVTVNVKLAEESGFVIPRFKGDNELRDFFAFWQPAALTTFNFKAHLYRYVMTVADARVFLAGAIEHWLLDMAASDPYSFQQLTNDWQRPGSVTGLIQSRFMSFAHFPSGLALRVPIGVPASGYSLLRVESPAEFPSTPVLEDGSVFEDNFRLGRPPRP